MMVAKVRERLVVNKQILQKFSMDRLNLKKLNEAEDKEKPLVGEVSANFC
jgi:hypothetical protein